MPTRETTVDVSVLQRPDTGENPTVDEAVTAVLSAYTSTTRQEVVLGAAQELSVTLTSSTLVFIRSTNGESFQLTLRTGQQQLSNLVCFMFVTDDASNEGMAAGDIVLEGNGTNQAELLILTTRTLV